MPKKSKTHQKLYNMKGCSRKNRKYLGGNSSSLAYPSNNVPTVPNPHLAYTRGGSNIRSAFPKNDPPVPTPSLSYITGSSTQKGGSGCGCELMKGGTCGASCAANFMSAGSKKKHIAGGNAGIKYPDGLVGNPWTPSIGGWPGVDNTSGGRNYLAYNNYNGVDISRQMISTGANPPFSIGGGKKMKKRKQSKKNKTKKHRGGTGSNFLAQDLVNLGRQMSFNFGSTYNALAGYKAPVNPMPFKDQLVSSNNMSSLKAAL
jgi:hypothetical protein